MSLLWLYFLPLQSPSSFHFVINPYVTHCHTRWGQIFGHKTLSCEMCVNIHTAMLKHFVCNWIVVCLYRLYQPNTMNLRCVPMPKNHTYGGYKYALFWTGTIIGSYKSSYVSAWAWYLNEVSTWLIHRIIDGKYAHKGERRLCAIFPHLTFSILRATIITKIWKTTFSSAGIFWERFNSHGQYSFS